MNKELIEALNVLEKENNISKDILLEAIENSLLTACKNHFGKADNVKVNINRETGDFAVYAEKEVAEDVEDPMLQISLAEAKMKSARYDLGDIVHVPINSKEFGRIATQNAKNVILQKIREEERKALFNDWYCKEKDVVTGIVQRYVNRNVCIDLGKIDAILSESEQVRGEVFRPTERIAREAGSRTKIAVCSNDPNVDPVGACVGLNGARVNAVVSELRGEKIDIINWDDNPAFLIENALSPAKVILVAADEEEREAQVIVPDYQLSLAIGKEGQNARLAARLTGYKIDIKSETQARESGLMDDLEMGYEDGFEGYTDKDLIGNQDEESDEGYEGELPENAEYDGELLEDAEYDGELPADAQEEYGREYSEDAGCAGDEAPDSEEGYRIQ